MQEGKLYLEKLQKVVLKGNGLAGSLLFDMKIKEMEFLNKDYNENSK